MKANRYTQEQIDFMKQHVKGRPLAELTEMFNARFGTNKSLTQMSNMKSRLGLKSGVKGGQFEKGLKAWNKGMKGLSIGGKQTQFKKGSIPPNHLPIGTERVNKNDLIEIKVADPGIWKSKHCVIWEQENGSIPEGHVVIFGDGNRRNFDIHNLLLVSRAQLVRLNQKKLIANDAELTKTGIIIADLFNRIGELNGRNKKNARKEKERMLQAQRKKLMKESTYRYLEAAALPSDEKEPRVKQLMILYPDVKFSTVKNNLVNSGYLQKSESHYASPINPPAITQKGLKKLKEQQETFGEFVSDTKTELPAKEVAEKSAPPLEPSTHLLQTATMPSVACDYSNEQILTIVKTALENRQHSDEVTQVLEEKEERIIYLENELKKAKKLIDIMEKEKEQQKEKLLSIFNVN